MTKKNPFSQTVKLIPGVLLVLASAITAVVYTSCGGKTADSTEVIADGSASREDLLKILEGGWVNVNYGEALNRVHSPMFAAEAGRPVQEMMFSISDVKGDTVYNGTGRLNYLDGERFDVVFTMEAGQTKMKIFEGPAYENQNPIYLNYKIADGDTILCVVNSKTNDSTWYTREFHKAPQKAGIEQNALEHYVNRNLFAGEWKDANGAVVTFAADGKVTGWAKWTWYSVEIDKYGSEIQPDVMSAYNDKMGATYVYTLDNNRLSIYEYDNNNGDGMWTRGKLVAELTRKVAPVQ